MLKDYQEFTAGPLVLPVNGKNYTVPPLSIEAGIRFDELASGRDHDAAQAAPNELWKLVLGPLWEVLLSDGVPSKALERIGLTAVADHQYGRDMAEATWEAGVDPNRLAALLTEKQAATGNRASRRSNSTGGAKKTSTAGTKGTTSPTT
ncbi:hypothetical protein KPL76_06170 [Subtercola sp. PAMC28395]|uniref:DUF7426 family protein n=1 Tax=Subtercola sp. PAMC28395 TaxID=2846775 RepID=UPI001C0E3E9F|nr:hypothetical protein [Subtercola sp. PAMC28395]QWT24939.1 hypothetical protein KPL76_06170 [Subtercola sp. PAMC28395]